MPEVCGQLHALNVDKQRPDMHTCPLSLNYACCIFCCGFEGLLSVLLCSVTACDTDVLLQPTGTTSPRVLPRSFNIDIVDMVQVGDLVYCRITSAERDLDPILACTDIQGKVCGCCASGSHAHASCLIHAFWVQHNQCGSESVTCLMVQAKECSRLCNLCTCDICSTSCFVLACLFTGTHARRHLALGS